MDDLETATSPQITSANGHSAPAAALSLLRRPGALPVIRFLLGMLAFGLAFLGERSIEDARLDGLSVPPSSGWWLLGAAALLFTVAMWPVPRLLPAVPAPFLSILRSMKRRALFLVPLVLALVCSLASIPLFVTLNTKQPDSPNPNTVPPLAHDWVANTGSWLLYIASLVLFGLAFVMWERTAPPPSQGGIEADPPGDRLPRRIEWLLITGLFALALLLRLPDLASAPPGLWFDEAQNGIVARQLTAPDAVHLTFIGDKTQMGALYFYILGVVLKLFGSAVWQLRLLPALAGSLIVPILYLLAFRMYGWRVGLAAGGLLAVSAWSITFSRFGLDSMFTVAFDVAIFLCVAQGLRTGRLGCYAGAGVLLGLALQMYYVSRLVPLVLLALLLHRLISGRMRIVRAVRAGIVVFAVGALLAFLPVGLFAIQQPDVYNSRVSTVSIFSEEGSGGDPDAFTHSLNRHLLMFNYAGDNNGRHNLPGQPMLDWITATLFFAGLGTCFLRAWRWQYFFPVVWFVAAISGGVLSLLFEAPQSHRTLELSVVTALVGGIFLGELWQIVSRVLSPRVMRATATPVPSAMPPASGAALPGFPFMRHHPASAASSLPVRKRAGNEPATTLPVRAHGPLSVSIPGAATAPTATLPTATEDVVVMPLEIPQSPPAERSATVRRTLAWALSVAGVLAVVAWAGSLDVHRYFDVQVKDAGVWKEMYSAQAEAARVLATYSDSRDIYVNAVYYNLPPSQYLAPNAHPTEWPGMGALPIKSGRDTVLVLDPLTAADLDAIARMYPHAMFNPLRAPSSPETLEWTVFIPASDVAALHGVHATVYDLNGQTRLTDTTLDSMQYDWGVQGAKPGTLRLSATVRVEQSGDYNFYWQTAGGSPAPNSLLVDGYSVQASAPISLSVGLHSVVATDTVKSPTGASKLLTAPVGSSPVPLSPDTLFDPRKIEPHGLTGLVRQGDTFDGPPTYLRVDPVISFYFQRTLLPNRPYTVEWIGRLYVPVSGPYVFSTEQLSKSRLLIDDKEILVNTQDNRTEGQSVQFSSGWHEISLFYEDLAGYSHVYLYWTPPGHTRSIIPSAFLWPRLGQYPSKPESGDWPTLAQADGSALPLDRIVSSQPVPTGQPQPVPPSQNAPTPAPPPVTPASPNANPSSAAGPQPTPLPVEPMQATLLLGGGADALKHPQAATLDDKGNFYIYTNGDSKVHKYDPSGKLLTTWAVQDAQGRPVTEGSAIVAQGTHVLVLDAATSTLLSYDTDGKPLGSLHLCTCYFPRSISLARDSNYWVADTGGAKVLKVSQTGQVLKSLEAKGSAPGQFVEPTGIWESPQGTVFVADIGNSRVQALSADLKPLAAWPMGSSIARDGNRLVGDSNGNILVTENESKAVVLYDPSGKELHRGAYSKEGNTWVPAGIAAVGGDRFLALFPDHDQGVVFSSR